MQEIHLYILKSNAKNQDIDRNKNKNKYVRHNTILGEKSPEIVTNVNEIEKKHKRSSLGKFLEKSIELLNKEKELHVLKTNLMKFEEMLKINRGILTNLEDEIKKEKTILKEIFYLRKNFWIKLLKQGLDCG